jgi:hypothetical protein
MIKELIISNKLFAKYEIGENHFKDILFLKMIIPIFNDNLNLSEDILTNIIGIIENKKFKGISYLNV